MTALFQDNFELYGGDVNKLLDGVWAEIGGGDGGGIGGTAELVIPPFEEDGRYWLLLDNGADAVRCAFPSGSVTGLGVWGQFHTPALPSSNNRQFIFSLQSAANAVILDLRVNTDGTLTCDGNTTATPVVAAGTSYNVQMEVDTVSGSVEVRVGAASDVMVTVLSFTGAYSSEPVAGYIHWHEDDAIGTDHPYYVKASCAYSLTGTYNSSWPNIDGIATTLIAGDTATAGFTPRPRDKFGENVFNISGVGAIFDEVGCRVDTSSAALSPEGGDYTAEGWFRWTELPAATKQGTLFARWSTASGKASYKLSLKGSSVDGGGLQYDISTDGTTITNVHNINWTPQIGVWYHVAVCRSGTDSRLFINGVQQGPTITDSATYFNNTTDYTIGNTMEGTNSLERGDYTMVGTFDEQRLTKGVARYTTNFTPPIAAFGRDAAEDPDFASVQMLTGFESGLTEVSNNTFTLVLGSGDDNSIVSYNDATADYQSAGLLPPYDDRYLEAAQVKATGILTVTALPTDGETVTIGGQAYTWKTTLTPSANEVLIGGTIDESLEHLQNAINNGPGEGTDYGTGTTANASATAEDETPASTQLTATSITAGTGGNVVGTTETMANGSWDAATLTGGLNLPGPSQFSLGNLPVTATGVRWLAMRHRSQATEGGAKVQLTLDIGGSTAAGADSAMTQDMQFYTDIIEEDPLTTGGLTVSAVQTAEIKIERTS